MERTALGLPNSRCLIVSCSVFGTGEGSEVGAELVAGAVDAGASETEGINMRSGLRVFLTMGLGRKPEPKRAKPPRDVVQIGVAKG